MIIFLLTACASLLYFMDAFVFAGMVVFLLMLIYSCLPMAIFYAKPDDIPQVKEAMPAVLMTETLFRRVLGSALMLTLVGMMGRAGVVYPTLILVVLWGFAHVMAIRLTQYENPH